MIISKYDAHRDLAILRHDIAAIEFYEPEASARGLKAGDNVVAIGYPAFGPGDKFNVRHGTVTSLPVKSAVQMIEVTQKLSQGMSGGPVIDADDAVVGIIHQGGPTEGRDFAIYVSALMSWLRKS